MATDNTNIVSALNAGSGINIKELAQALVDAEKVPRESLVQSKIDKSDAKISGLLERVLINDCLLRQFFILS